MKKGSKSKRAGELLSDHKREGKKFIPPMLTLGVFKEVGWKENILPELIWVALINEKYGPRDGAELCLKVAQAAIEAVSDPDKKQKPLYAGASSFALLNDAEQNKMVELLDKKSKLWPVRAALQPLVFFYPECPMSFLFRDNAANRNDGTPDIQVIKRILDAHFNRWDKPATMVQANAVYIAFVTGKLKVFEGLSLANFPAIQNFPETEESLQVAGAVRGTVSTFFGGEADYLRTSWPSYFWNRGLELEGCTTGD
jgi:hypothetical protein